MPCYKPLKGWRAKEVNSDSGRRPIVFNINQGFADLPIVLPCGQCIGCRIDRSKAWAARCYHEASLHEDNCFITLTYATEHLPTFNSLDITHFQKFMKRLRKKYSTKTHKIKVFYCGEYGPKLGRPHFHAILFNHDFQDKRPWKKNKNGDVLYTSYELEQLWPHGFSSSGAVTFQSSAYVARYILKKVTGNNSSDHYRRVNLETGEYYNIAPEFAQMSQGIGKGWIERYMRDAYSGDFIIIDGKKIRVPRFYDKVFEEYDAITALGLKKETTKLKGKRKQNAKKHEHNNTPDRLAVREEIQEARIGLLKREEI